MGQNRYLAVPESSFNLLEKTHKPKPTDSALYLQALCESKS